ncbi:MAG: hypothetical protein RR891_04295 [Clostridium sp.]
MGQNEREENFNRLLNHLIINYGISTEEEFKKIKDTRKFNIVMFAGKVDSKT